MMHKDYLGKIFSLLLVIILAIPLVATITTYTHGTTRSASPMRFSTVQEMDRQLACMTKNIYYEAASEPAEGKIAVAQIVMNRVQDGRFASTPCEVIYQKNTVYNRVICQFSWFCDGSVKRRDISHDLWQESEIAAKKVMLEGFRLPTLQTALYYHADYVDPKWRKRRITQIGRHIFYQDI